MKILSLLTILFLCTISPAQALDFNDIEAKWQSGWYEEVGALVADAAAQKNADHRALYFKARALLFTRHLEEAQDWAEKAAKAAPDSATYWAQLGAAKAFRIQEKPMRGITLGRSCKKDFEKAVKLDPTNLESLWALMRFNMHAPGIVGGNKDKAWEMADKIMALNPAQGHQALAQLHVHLDEDPVKAQADNRAAAAADPTNAKICFDIGQSLLNRGLRDEALEFYHLGAEREKNTAEGLVKLAGAYMRIQDLDRAEDYLRQAQATAPEELSATLWLGEILRYRGHAEEAIAHFRAILNEHPDYVPARFHLGQALVQANRDIPEAAELLQSYLDTQLNMAWPSRSKANWQLALAQEKMGSFDRAWESITLAKELSWGGDHLDSDMQRLEFMAKD
jgi:tetratricopeptide (TPR) repeat protein|nr:tetratricopeptide repeat protein [Candidatus Krumholzibacteria bacterium]